MGREGRREGRRWGRGATRNCTPSTSIVALSGHYLECNMYSLSHVFSQLDSHRTRHGFTAVGELEQCIHYKVGMSRIPLYRHTLTTPHHPLTMHSSPPTYPLTPYIVQHERMKFLCIGTKTGIEVYAWAQKPYSKFMAFKVAVQRKSDTVLNFTN